MTGLVNGSFFPPVVSTRERMASTQLGFYAENVVNKTSTQIGLIAD